MKIAEKRVYTVSEITRDIHFILEDNFGAVWIEGEVSGFKPASSGHMYFSIKDGQSVLSCVLFRGTAAKIKFEIKDGMQVLIFGKISVYDKRGQYQLIVNKVEPRGAGALQFAFEQLKERLKKEGLFDETHKKQIPYLPQRIGVITSPTGAAIRDILSVTKRRFSNIEIILNPVSVQGDAAKSEIAGALDMFNALGNVDVIILGRGGGSLEDLWSFNEEEVARAVFRSKIPVISAIGHQIDYTISDFVADLRAETPTAAAQLVIPEKEELVGKVDTLRNRLKLALISKKDFLTEKLRTLENRRSLREPFNIIVQREQEIDDFAEELVKNGDHFIMRVKTENLKAVAGKLHALSPLGILSRGYSVTLREKDGKVIKDAGPLEKNEIIKTKLVKGEIISKVEEVVRHG